MKCIIITNTRITTVGVIMFIYCNPFNFDWIEHIELKDDSVPFFVRSAYFVIVSVMSFDHHHTLNLTRKSDLSVRNIGVHLCRSSLNASRNAN